MEINKAYEGREHSAVKHTLLKGYLEKLLFIKGISQTKEITYVDCFAGPYQDETDDLQATSIGVSLDILSKVRESLAARGTYVTFRAIYVEEDKARYERLQAYLEASCPRGIQASPIRGDYAEQVDEILERCGKDSFVFFFIDPFGWTDVSIPRLCKLLRRPKSEFLITFMYEDFNRFITKSELRQQVSELLGPLSDEDYQKLSDLTSKERERFIVRKYSEQIMAAMGPDGPRRSRSYSAVVKRKSRERTKYHLVYGTRHPKGIIEFAEQSDKARLVERVVRLQVRHNASPHGSLFTPEEEAGLMEEAMIDLDQAKCYWLTKLSDQPTIFDETRLADMLEETGWLLGEIEEAFMALQSEGKVQNVDAGRKRPIHPINFQKGERLRRCV